MPEALFPLLSQLNEPADLRALDEEALGQVVDEQTRSGRLGPSGFDLDWLVSADGNQIAEVQLFGTVTAFSGYGIDDLVLIRVPEPATLALFIVGLAGLGFMMRRRSSMQLKPT